MVQGIRPNTGGQRAGTREGGGEGEGREPIKVQRWKARDAQDRVQTPRGPRAGENNTTGVQTKPEKLPIAVAARLICVPIFMGLFFLVRVLLFLHSFRQSRERREERSWGRARYSSVIEGRRGSLLRLGVFCPLEGSIPEGWKWLVLRRWW